MASSASRPPATEVFELSGTSITGRSVCAATTPGSGGKPSAGDDHAQTPNFVLRVLRHRVRVAVGAHHAQLMPNSPLVEP